jgi:putative flavoprotein involved in K+ transport
MPEQVETVIIGGGPAGLATSFWLSQAGREHVILERGRLAERWRSERWDSLVSITPNWLTQLPGIAYQGDDPDGFLRRDAVIELLEAYAASFQPPLREGAPVAALQRQPGTDRYLVRTAHQTLVARNVVVATGAYQQPKIPPLSAALPAHIHQLASRDYRTPTQLPPGAVLIVGSGAAGLQICEDLLAGGRTVYVSIGRAQRWPRRYRGHDVLAWFQAMGLLDDVGRCHYLDPKYGGGAVLTGVRGGHDLDYDRLAAAGVRLLGRLQGVAAGRLDFADDLRQTLALWDASRDVVTDMIDAYIQRVGLDAPPDVAAAPAPARAWRSRPPLLAVDLAAHEITTVVWATGFGYDFRWIEAPVLDADGVPSQQRGVTACRGLYFLGLRGMHTLKSSFLGGVGDDAAYIAAQITARRSA